MLNALAAGITAVLFLSSVPIVASNDESFDVLIKGGTVIDGTGGAAYVADVGITGDTIVSIGQLQGATATKVIDATGQVVSPGFIDLEMGAYLGDPVTISTNENMVQMGVTTGMISWEAGPVNMRTQREDLERLGIATNILMFFPVGSAWSQIVGDTKVPPSPAQLEGMKALARQAMEDGAFGIGAAIEYCPLCNSETEPIIEIAKEAKPYNGFYASHIRNEANGVINATAELIRIAKEAGIAGHVGHMKVAGAPNCGNSDITTGLVWDALRRGVDISSAQYPYTAGQTTDIGYLIPDWAEAGTPLEVQLRLRDPAQRPKIIEEVHARIAEVTGTADKIEFQPHGTTLQQEADLRRASPGETVLQIKENEQTRLTIIHFGCDYDLENIMKQPWNSIATDMGPWIPIHELSAWHPRGAGTFPRILGEYVREKQLMTLEEAVRKMTGQPAYRAGMAYAERGLLEEGWAADVVVFDPQQVIDKATYADRGRFSEGINWVMINGVLVKEDGALTPLHERLIAKPGRVLIHTKDMPSTPQPGYDDRVLPNAAPDPLAESSPKMPALSAMVALGAVGLVALAVARRVRK